MRIVIIIALCAVVGFIGLWLQMLAWNYVAPLFKMPTLDMLQMFCVNVCVSLLGTAFTARLAAREGRK